MARAKRSLFQLLGWLVWKLLSILGVKKAKEKLAGEQGGRGRSRNRR